MDPSALYANAAVRESIAQGMSHSVQMADRVYDRRTAESKMRKGVAFRPRSAVAMAIASRARWMGR